MKKEIHFDIGRMTACGVPMGACIDDLGFLRKATKTKDNFGEVLISNFVAGSLTVRLNEDRIVGFVFVLNAKTRSVTDDVGWWFNGVRIFLSRETTKEEVMGWLGPCSREWKDDSDASLVFLNQSSDCEIIWDSSSGFLKAIFLTQKCNNQQP